MKVLRWSIRLHKWIALVVGIQVLFWVVGGLVMTAIPIERVRGEHLTAAPPPRAIDPSNLLPLTDVVRRSGVSPIKAELRSTPRGTVWTLTPVKGEAIILDAGTGLRPTAISENDAVRFAKQFYSGAGPVVSAVYLPKAPPETGKEGPLWRVEFKDAERTSLYLLPTTGEVVSRRSNLWRFYDFFWRLHIMDWTEGKNFNHPLIIGAALLALTVAISGFFLLWNRLGRDFKHRKSVRRLEAEGVKTGPVAGVSSG